ncbi:Pvc16 family protein [Labrys okinawensis]|uniref:Pvc16 family protein n=1 Tax=Labrys okinawensis TaxID=346911 RepID=UPI0039BC7B67
MTAALAIAATSEILRFLVDEALRKTGQALNFTPPAVTIGSPPAGNTATPSVNLFLCQALPNSSLRNAPGFVRGPLGDRPSQQPLLLDLFYLASGHGPGSAREIGLGAAIETLQQTPIVTTALISTALRSLDGDPDPLRRALSDQAVIDGFESIAIKAQSLGLDSTAGLWIAAQAPLSPSASYVVTIAFKDPSA